MTVSFVLVPENLVESVWVKAMPHIVKGEKYWKKYFTLSQMLEFLLSGRQQLWLMVDGPDVLYAMVTQIDDYPNVRSLRVCYFGGSGLNPAWMGQFKRVETWAREQGCGMMEFVGRDDWERLLAKMFDYHSEGKVYQKDL